jgi:hypothetical protein
MGATGVLSNTFSYQANAIKLSADDNNMDQLSLVQLSNEEQIDGEEIANVYGIPDKEEK